MPRQDLIRIRVVQVAGGYPMPVEPYIHVSILCDMYRYRENPLHPVPAGPVPGAFSRTAISGLDNSKSAWRPELFRCCRKSNFPMFRSNSPNPEDSSVPGNRGQHADERTGRSIDGQKTGYSKSSCWFMLFLQPLGLKVSTAENSSQQRS